MHDTTHVKDAVRNMPVDDGIRSTKETEALRVSTIGSENIVAEMDTEEAHGAREMGEAEALLLKAKLSLAKNNIFTQEVGHIEAANGLVIETISPMSSPTPLTKVPSYVGIWDTAFIELDQDTFEAAHILMKLSKGDQTLAEKPIQDGVVSVFPLPIHKPVDQDALDAESFDQESFDQESFDQEALTQEASVSQADNNDMDALMKDATPVGEETVSAVQLSRLVRSDDDEDPRTNQPRMGAKTGRVYAWTKEENNILISGVKERLGYDEIEKTLSNRTHYGMRIQLVRLKQRGTNIEDPTPYVVPPHRAYDTPRKRTVLERGHAETQSVGSLYIMVSKHSAINADDENMLGDRQGDNDLPTSGVHESGTSSSSSSVSAEPENFHKDAPGARKPTTKDRREAIEKVSRTALRWTADEEKVLEDAKMRNMTWRQIASEVLPSRSSSALAQHWAIYQRRKEITKRSAESYPALEGQKASKVAKRSINNAHKKHFLDLKNAEENGKEKEKDMTEKSPAPVVRKAKIEARKCIHYVYEKHPMHPKSNEKRIIARSPTPKDRLKNLSQAAGQSVHNTSGSGEDVNKSEKRKIERSPASEGRLRKARKAAR
ncbi:hypothetical protein GQ43DRAFT_469351 [Delitschia confertaspora ATCC 74209]|uniref:Myb-like domain-containing protein n=1 Tax=Delitschia confertaspora ATCC 74209 TaxID=1513339 RepID=A0A9P4MVI7_9PLEO|nr:hypothetical protein GQ43DRAFT_469351 [Delitschia confertaspora ATCC 74209]